MKKILIVEDDIKIRDELSLFLSRNGFSVEKIIDFTNVINEIMDINPDLVLLDINLPNIDGYHICREVRRLSDLPIIVVTSRDSDIDELMSMNYGADDFVTKPYNTQILLARIQSILRRTSSVSEVLTVKDIHLNLSDSSMSCNNVKVDLTKNELKIIHLLMNHENTIVSRNKIMDVLWQSNEFIDDNTLTVNINRIRKKLELLGKKDILITKRGQGYII
ncbi:response regulator transcription factor [Acidaminobacter sp. JC074]|uniref:response regulator transcription factor n=1 Tax=Acidaminobacter sp. JC074 TaxID=2530199 RepID=UPI001F0D29D6|nr:response regulator transcription factor [Acidaminobacter sp. JC074]MCH4889794.1 response regulator transcription factor [Acidaminobacter sp. JC074]